VQIDPMKPMLKAPGTKRLKLNYDEPLSKLAFKFRLRRFTEVSDGEDREDWEPLYGEQVARKEDGTWVLRETRRRLQGAVMAGAYTRSLLSST
jgi:hypothetical protein